MTTNAVFVSASASVSDSGYGSGSGSGALQRSAPRAAARYVPVVARFLLGAVFVVCGLNGFLNFIPAPSEPMPAGAVAFGGALMQTGYMMPFIKGTEVVAGAALLANRFVALALAVLAPIVLNIVAFHAFLAPSGLAVAVVVLLLQIRLAWAYRAVYAPMLSWRSRANEA